MIMKDLHEGLSQACFISSLRLLKLCQSFLSHSTTFGISFPGTWNCAHNILLLNGNFSCKKNHAKIRISVSSPFSSFQCLSPTILMLQVLQTTILQAKIRKCCFQALSTESLSVSMSPLRVSHKFQLLFHPALFSILEDGCCIKDCKILFYFGLYISFSPIQITYFYLLLFFFQ